MGGMPSGQRNFAKIFQAALQPAEIRAILMTVETGQRTIPSPTGRHLRPGEISLVDDTPRVRQDIAGGRLYVVPQRPSKGDVTKESKGRVAPVSKPEEGASE